MKLFALILSMGLSQFSFAANEALLTTTTVPTTSVAYLIYTMLEKGGSPEVEITKFVRDNELDLVQNIAVGSGRSLEALANLAGVQGAENQIRFYQNIRNEFEALFPEAQTLRHETVAKRILVLANQA